MNLQTDTFFCKIMPETVTNIMLRFWDTAWTDNFQLYKLK